METMITTMRKVLTLDEPFYRDFLAGQNVMKRGFLILLACFFIGTFPVFGQGLISGIQGFTPQMAAEVQEQFRSAFQQFQPPGGDEQLNEQFLNDYLIGINIGVDVSALPAPLPRPVAAFFTALGSWFSAALRGIGPWLGYGALVLLIAKLSGGRGNLNHFFGLTALFAVASLLRLFSFIPFLGAALALVGFIWAIFIYIRAVQISQEFSAGKAIAVTFLPALIILLLTACLGTMGLAGAVALISSAG